MSRYKTINGANIALRMPMKMKRRLSLQGSQALLSCKSVSLTLQSTLFGSWLEGRLFAHGLVYRIDTPSNKSADSTPEHASRSCLYPALEKRTTTGTMEEVH